VIRDEPQLDQLPADTPRAIRGLLGRCLERDPRLRLRDIGEARILLAAPLDRQGAVTSTAPQATRGATWPLAVGAVALSAAVGVFVWQVKPAPVVPMRRFELPAEIAAASEFALSPDGSRLAYVADRHLYVHAFDAPTLEAQDLGAAGGLTSDLFWSPDGRTIGFVSQGTIPTARATRAGSRRADSPRVDRPRWDPWTGPAGLHRRCRAERQLVRSLARRALPRLRHHAGQSSVQRVPDTVPRGRRALAGDDRGGDAAALLAERPRAVLSESGAEPGRTRARTSHGRTGDARSRGGVRRASGRAPGGRVDTGRARLVRRRGGWALDLFVAFRDRPNALFRNDAGRFVDIAPAVGLADSRRSVGGVWFDYDDDGDFDLAVGNMDGDPNGLFRHDTGRFTDIAAEAGVAWGGRAPGEPANGTVRPCAADVNGDGRLDLFFANYGPNGLFLNRGNGRFEDASRSWGVAIDGRYDTCAFADVDHDGRLDVYVNGTVTGGVSHRDYLFRNGGARFDDVTPENLLALQASHGAQWADFDADGDADLALAGSRPDAMRLLLRNTLPAADAARAIAVRVVDAEGRATRAGATVRVFAAGTRRLLALRLVDSGSGYDAQNDMPVHVGLAADGPVDIEVTWPRVGRSIVGAARNVDPRRWRARAIVVRVPGG
jgi:hypothetical protein